MPGKPLGIEIDGSFEWPARPGDGCPTGPIFGGQRGQNRQKRRALGGEGVERGLKVQVGVVRALDPRLGVDGLDGRLVFGKDHVNAITPNIRARAQMAKHLRGGPFTWAGGGAQLGWRHAGGEVGDMRRCIRQQGQNLRGGECSTGHVRSSLRSILWRLAPALASGLIHRLSKVATPQRQTHTV